MNITFFKNNLRCREHTQFGIGASCAVDVLLEIYHYAIFKQTKDIHLLRNVTGLTGKLNSASYMREKVNNTSCWIRAPVWRWLVEEMPKAYAPKGRGDAEILEAFRWLSNPKNIPSLPFSIQRRDSTCKNCGQTFLLEETNVPVPLPITYTLAQRAAGYLPDAIAGSLLQRHCSECNDNTAGNFTLPEFMMVEIGLVNNRNRQDPPILIPEHFSFGRMLLYELVGAVMVKPDHFYCVVKKEDRFVVLDDLRDTSVAFQSFAGAVLRDSALCQDHHFTSANEDGVHLLVYHSKSQRNERRVTVTAVEKNDVIQYSFSALHTTEVPQTISSFQDDTSQIEQQNKDQDSSDMEQLSREKGTDCNLGTPSKLDKKSENADYGAETPENRHYSAEKFTGPIHSVRRKLIPDTCNNDSDRITLIGLDVSSTKKNGRIFLSCKEFFTFTGLQSHIENHGFKFIDARLSKSGLVPAQEFLREKQLRQSISLQAIKCIIQGKFKLTLNSKELLHAVDAHLETEGMPGLRTTSHNGCKSEGDKRNFSTKAKQNMFEPTGFLQIDGARIRYKLLERQSNEIGLHCGYAFAWIDFEKHIKHNGFSLLNRHLEKSGFVPNKCYLKKGRSYMYITLKAFLEILSSKVISKQKKDAREGLMAALAQDAAIGASIKKQIPTPKRNKFKSPVTVFSSTKMQDMITKGTKRRKLILKRKETGLKKQTSVLKTELRAICEEHFDGSKNGMVRSFAGLIKPVKKRKIDTIASSSSFSGYFGIDDMVSMLKNAKGKKTKHGERQNALEQIIVTEAKDVYNFQPSELIYLAENFSGKRLFDELRKKIPGILPSRRVEQTAKKELQNEFDAILLPKRTPSGWQIDPSRLMEVLRFKYHTSNGSRHWKLYGDGREIGGRQSTFVAVSFLNNEGFFVDGSFQNPKNVYPLNIFYESDSRDNIEENLGFPCRNDQIFREMTDDVFYLTGDEMFLEAMLDPCGELGPMTDTGWNIYRKCDKRSKELTAEDGLRTSLHLEIDRQHKDRIFTAVPTERTVMCALHAITRCVEKFLNLEIQNILSEGNKETQRGGDGEGWKRDAIHNLEANISLRGIRHGNFRVLFDKSGNPESVSLNKDHAIGVIAPALPDFPHVLSGVVKKRKATLQVPPQVRNRLGLTEALTEYDHVKLIWDHFYHMTEILLKDPLPANALEDEIEFQWGYTEADKKEYLDHAEIFYQLFCARYTAKSLTPYMMKLIDHVPELMRILSFPIARFQSEGGEHLNYQHNLFYFQHTTRNGGNGNPDPLVAILQSTWNRLYHSIEQLTLSDDEEKRETGHSFISFCTCHTAAAIIQRCFRAYIVRKKLDKVGWTSRPMSGQQRKNNLKVRMNIRDIFPKKETLTRPFLGTNFVLVGAVPAQKKKKMTQNEVQKVIVDNGGRVKTAIPFRQKGISTKKYVVLTTQEMLEKKKVPLVVKVALRKNFDILHYGYVFSCLEEKNGKVDRCKFRLNTENMKGLIKDPTTSRKHFHKTKTFISILKKARRAKTAKVSRICKTTRKKKCRNPAQLFVQCSLQNHCGKMSKIERRNLISDLFTQWTALPSHIKFQFKMQWQKQKMD